MASPRLRASQGAPRRILSLRVPKDVPVLAQVISIGQQYQLRLQSKIAKESRTSLFRDSDRIRESDDTKSHYRTRRKLDSAAIQNRRILYLIVSDCPSRTLRLL
jgi:hypothetical protein